MYIHVKCLVDDDTVSCFLSTKTKSLKIMTKSPCTGFQQAQVKVIRKEKKTAFSLSYSFAQMLQSPTILEYAIYIFIIISALNHQLVPTNY